MRRIPNERWLRLHTIASTQRGASWYSDGLQAVVDGENAGIISYALDSYMEIADGSEIEWNDNAAEWQYNWMWEGTSQELYYAAEHCTDLMFPERKLSREDSDYNDLMQLYTAIRTHLRKTARKKAKRKKQADTDRDFSFLLDIESEQE